MDYYYPTYTSGVRPVNNFGKFPTVLVLSYLIGSNLIGDQFPGWRRYAPVYPSTIVLSGGWYSVVVLSCILTPLPYVS